MIYKPLIFVILIVVGFLLVPQITWAANIIIDSNAHFTFTLWYGSNRNNVQPTWEGQGVGPGRLDYNQVCCSMPEGWYTWNITGWPSGYRLVGIDGAAYQQAGTAYWNVRWEPSGYTLNVSKSGTGSGTVTGSGINCGGDCSEFYQSGACVEYFHSEDSGSTWGGWSGACTGPGCVICFDSNKNLTATFNSAPPPPPSVSVSVNPTTVNQGENVTVTWSVSGSVTGCSATGNWPAWSGSTGTSGYSSTTTGGLTENPTTFGVSCTGPGGTGSDSKSVTVIKRYTLNVSKSGTGSGTVTGSGINCGGDCSEFYQSGACVEYFHSEDSGSTWGGWSGACTGPGCVICFDSNKNLTATFNKKKPPTVSITCSPGTIPYNSSANVSWTSNNTSNCTVSPTGWTGKSGSQSTGNLTSSQTYTVNCTGE